METKKGTSTYQALSSTDFTNGIPIDPLQSTWDDWATEGKCGTKTSGYPSRCWYCKNNNNSSVRKTSPGNCNSDDWSTGDSNWGTGVTDWIICANLETGSPSYYCRSNQR
ncbi:hypothetical protein HYS94_01370 [Candidatus Daviesbacteria bacterium]|nr:hypothetical protein [Candidatus Daviesbacteria bacterium]